MAAQPEIRALEESIDPYLEQSRDAGDPASVRAFFARAALPAVRHVGFRATTTDGVSRHAFVYPMRPDCGAEAAQLLAAHDKALVAGPGRLLAGSTMYVHGDIVVRVIDLQGSWQHVPEQAAGFSPGRTARELSRLLDLAASDDLLSRAGIERFLAQCSMDLVTDRRAQDA
jgi:hypothetical protein